MVEEAVEEEVVHLRDVQTWKGADKVELSNCSEVKASITTSQLNIVL